MTLRARTRFRVAESEGGPFIVLEPLSGDDLPMFKNKLIAFDLKLGTSIEKAEAVRDYLNSTLEFVAETDLAAPRTGQPFRPRSF